VKDRPPSRENANAADGDRGVLSVISVFDGGLRALFDGWISVDRFPDATERAAVLAAVKDAARR
jgi:hypothetical protein